ncbi:MAG TPA: hypothetical protein VKV95_10390 [Terriglobia bacterium]|nr:hypothetical protein [Terriglobia bacterium]
MIPLIAYIAAAALLLASALLLIFRGRNQATLRSDSEREINLRFLENPGLDLAERIFDPADFCWLRDELKFPEQATVLALQRKEMALLWLRCLRASFNELVRIPQSAGTSSENDSESSGWATTFYTLRFQFLLAYAMMVVWLFGPYTRIAPSFNFLRPILSRGTHKQRFGLRV